MTNIPHIPESTDTVGLTSIQKLMEEFEIDMPMLYNIVNKHFAEQQAKEDNLQQKEPEIQTEQSIRTRAEAVLLAFDSYPKRGPVEAILLFSSRVFLLFSLLFFIMGFRSDVNWGYVTGFVFLLLAVFAVNAENRKRKDKNAEGTHTYQSLKAQCEQLFQAAHIHQPQNDGLASYMASLDQRLKQIERKRAVYFIVKTLLYIFIISLVCLAAYLAPDTLINS